jgi:hypothetical protein
VLGTLSYYVVEAPIRRHGLSGVVGRSGARAIGLLTLPVTAVLVWAATGAVATLPTARFETGEQARVGWLNPAAHTRILIVGDSVGFALGFSFPQKEYPDASVVTGVVFGCGTAEQSIAVKGKLLPSGNKAECDDVFGTWADLVKYKNPNVVVWSLGGWEVFDHVLDGKVRRVTSPEYAKHVRSRLEVGLAELGPDVKVVIPNVPCYDQPSVSLHGEDMADDRNDPSRGRAVNKILGEFANDHDNVTIFDVASQVCPGGKFVEKIDGVKIRSDGVHYTADGVRFFWKWIMPALEDLVAKSR